MTRQAILRTTDLLATNPKRITFPNLVIGPLNIGNVIDQASALIEDDDGSLGFPPTEDDFFKVIDVDGVTTLFTGLLSQVTQRNHEPNGIYYDVVAQGWGALLDRVECTATEVYAAGFSDVYIVRDILTKYFGAIASGAPAHVLNSNRSSMPAETFVVGTSLRAILDQIAKDAFKPFYYLDAGKALHWNDVLRIAPWAVSTVNPDGVNLHAMGNIEDFVDFTGVAYRVTVNGAGGSTYTATDWPLVAKYNQRISDEVLAPTMRIRQLPDVTDATLATVAECTQRAFSLLATVRPRRVIHFTVWEAGLFPGMRIDFFNGHRLTPTLFPRGASRSVVGNAFVARRAGRMVGRFLIQSVTPTPLSQTMTQFDIQAGAYEPGLTNSLAKV